MHVGQQRGDWRSMQINHHPKPQSHLSSPLHLCSHVFKCDCAYYIYLCMRSGGWCLQDLFQIGRLCTLCTCLHLKNRHHTLHTWLFPGASIYTVVIYKYMEMESLAFYFQQGVFLTSSWKTRETWRKWKMAHYSAVNVTVCKYFFKHEEMLVMGV